jgi:hypothetical protein
MKLGNECKEGKNKNGSPYLQGGVLQVHKWERIDDYPLHANLKTVIFQIRSNFLENLGII